MYSWRYVTLVDSHIISTISSLIFSNNIFTLALDIEKLENKRNSVDHIFTHALQIASGFDFDLNE